MNNQRGIIIHQEEGKSEPVQSKFAHNVYWNNETDTENCVRGSDAIEAQPEFIDAANGNFLKHHPGKGDTCIGNQFVLVVAKQMKCFFIFLIRIEVWTVLFDNENLLPQSKCIM